MFRPRPLLLALAALLAAGCGGVEYEEITAPPPTIADDPQQRRLAGSVRPQHADLRPGQERHDMLKALRIRRAEWEQMQHLTMSDPSQILDQLLAAERVHEVGFDRIRGRFVTRYEVHVNLRKVDTRGSKERAALAKTFKRLAKAFGYGAYDADVWVDAGNRVRRVSLKVEIDQTKGQPPITVTKEFHGFGKPVRIKRPPAVLTWDVLGGGKA